MNLTTIRTFVKRWYPSSLVDAQSAHIAWGAVIMLVTHLYGFNLWWCFGFLTLWIVVKEYVFDLIIEQDSLEYSTIDAALYVVGAILALLVILTT